MMHVAAGREVRGESAGEPGSNRAATWIGEIPWEQAGAQTLREGQNKQPIKPASTGVAGNQTGKRWGQLTDDIEAQLDAQVGIDGYSGDVKQQSDGASLHKSMKSKQSMMPAKTGVAGPGSREAMGPTIR